MRGGASRRRKGHDFERAVARAFADIFGDGVRRGLQYRDGAEAPDVIVPGFWVECKAGRRTNPRAALEQAEAAMGERPLIAVGICKDDRDPPFVVLRLEAFLGLVARGRAR